MLPHIDEMMMLDAARDDRSLVIEGEIATINWSTDDVGEMMASHTTVDKWRFRTSITTKERR